MRAPRILRRVFDHAADRSARVEMTRLPTAERPHLVDSHTRTFWSHGATAAATLVEAERADPGAPAGRASTLVADHERGLSDSDRPRANPAFSEAVFVELMRARQYRRAYTLLTPECQQSWGTLEAFIAAQRIGALATLRGVTVNRVRHLEHWRDPDSGMVHAHAAELDVEYTIGDASRTVSLPRTVHLVAHRGAWRSLCYPTATRQP
jgi:hypothetical protein